MAVENIPIKILLKGESLDCDGVLHYPKISVLYNNDKITDTVTIEDVQELVFNVDIDDDIESSNTISVLVETDDESYFPYRETEEGYKDFGTYVKDIHINEISIESLLYEHGRVKFPLCHTEEEYADNGFIQTFLIPNNFEDEIHNIEGQYWWISKGDYIHTAGAEYSFTFKTPLYLWLLELLLQ